MVSLRCSWCGSAGVLGCAFCGGTGWITPGPTVDPRPLGEDRTLPEIDYDSDAAWYCRRPRLKLQIIPAKIERPAPDHADNFTRKKTAKPSKRKLKS